MYSFEGEFRRGPVQSFGGASCKEHREDLIRRAQEERQRRENLRIQNESAIKIQTLYRGYRTRKKEAMCLREIFDSKLLTFPKQSRVNVRTVSELCSQLLFFYNGKTDQSRLLWICQQMLSQKEEVVELMVENCDKMLHEIKLVLRLCLLCIENLNPSVSLAMPMRMLEVFTATETYTKIPVKENKIRPHVVQNIFEFLCNKGYFKSLRVLLNSKVPVSHREKSPHPPVPIAESIFDLIMRPVNFAVSSGNKQFCTSVLGEVCRELFCPPHSQQIEDFLLPAMAYGKYPFPFVELIQALIDKTAEKNETRAFSVRKQPDANTKRFPDPTPWLLYAVLVLGKNYIQNLTAHQTYMYLMMLQNLVPTLPLPRILNQEAIDDDDNDSDTEDMIVDSEANDIASQEKLRESCLQFLDSVLLARRIINCLNELSTPDVLVAICNICHSLMCDQRIPIHKLRLLYTLAFNADFMKRLWVECTFRYSISVNGSKTALIHMLARGISLADSDVHVIVPLLSVFCSAFGHSLHTLHDSEFYGDSENSIPIEFKEINTEQSTSMPFSLNELVPMSLTLRDACLGIIELANPEAKLVMNKDYQQALNKTRISLHTEENLSRSQTHLWRHLFKSISTLVKQLHSRDTRRQFCPPNHWLANHVHIRTDKIYNLHNVNHSGQPESGIEEGPPLSGREIWNLIILTELPFVVRFTERVKILHQYIGQDREEHQSEMANFQMGPSINVKIRRSYIYEDAFEKLSEENEPNLKLRLRVRLVNSAGMDEAGIDGGGLSREFLSELLKTGFDPNRGFFKYTNDKVLYPNPQAPALFDNYTDHYYFLGRMLGKAIYENLLVELPFAQFFLSKILNRHGIDLDIHHLASLDIQMYRNLLFLKTYQGDVKELGLDFTVVTDELGVTKTEELKLGGHDIQVDNHNRIEYIHLMADYKLNKQIRAHCHAFRSGLANVVDLEWLRMFDHHELQELISGANMPVNLDDLRQHTNYSGGFTAEHPVIAIFWKVVQDLTDQQRRQLLKFVTSCSRPPLLGFKDLYPVFCIHNAGNESERLPTASTCMNLLKLPEFYNEETMRSKLLYAIESGTGFELS